MLDNAYKLKVIQTGAGYDNVDIEYCREKGIRVCNAPSINTDEVAEHASASKEKTNMISDKAFYLMKNDALLINTARGSLVDEEALCRALENKVIGGAMLDVFKKEPLPFRSCLRKFDNIIMTPHNAGEPDLINSYKKRFSFFAENMKTVLDNRVPEGKIVKPAYLLICLSAYLLICLSAGFFFKIVFDTFSKPVEILSFTVKAERKSD